MLNISLTVLFNSGIEKTYDLDNAEPIKDKKELDKAIEQVKTTISQAYEKNTNGQINFTTTDGKTTIIKFQQTAAITIQKKI